MPKTYNEYLKYEFTDAEITEAARELANANRTRASLEQRKKEVDSSLKAQIEEQNSNIARLSNLISTGFEYRDIECRQELDTPEPGKKRIVRLDTGEEVRVVCMTEQDRQMVLDLQAAAEKKEAEDRAAQQPPAQEPLQLAGPDGKIVGEGFTAEVVTDALSVGAEVDGPALASAREAAGGTHQAKKAREGK